MKRILIAAAVALPLALSAAAPQAQSRGDETPVLPGYWEYTTRALGDTNTENRCVRPSEINRFFNGLSTRLYTCTYPVREVADGQARFEGTCRSRGGRQLRVRLNGPYQPESFQFDGAVSMRIGGGIWTPYIPGSVRARRISATCPPGAEYF